MDHLEIKPFTFQDISEHLPAELMAEVDYVHPSHMRAVSQWNKEGVVYIPNAIPNHLLKDYSQLWTKENQSRPGGWPYCTPYMQHKALRDLCLYAPLTSLMHSLIGEPAGLHLNLTGWISTERKWHQDTYLNPPGVGAHYIAAWIALEDIDPDSGPFQYVPGSHTWPAIRRDKLFQFLPPGMASDHRWPSLTQDAVAAELVKEIAARDAEITTYLPKRGDVLLWHSNLVHQGSKPNIPGLPRRTCIAHYSSIYHRPDFPPARMEDNGSWYFPINEQTGV